MQSRGDRKADELTERERYEQTLMRIGRKLQSLGQLLEQAPAHLVAKGYATDPSISGERPVQIDLDELRDIFDPGSPRCVGRVLESYHQLLVDLHRARPD
jgi:hypothetical protein